MKTLRHGLLTLAILGVGCTAQGQVIIGWDFGTASANLSSDINVPVTNLTVSNVSSFTGQTLTNANSSGSTGYSGASGTFNASFAAVSGAFNGTTSSAFVFTLTPSAGYTVSISSITFGSRSTASGPTALAIRTSSDNFASNAYSTSVSANSTWGLVNSGALTSITGTNLNPLTVRIYGSGGSSASAGNWRIDDLHVTLTVSAAAIPEPSTYAAILGCAALTGVLIRRRRLQSAA